MILSNQPHGYEFKEIKRRLVKKGSYGYAVTELQNYFELENTGYFADFDEIKKNVSVHFDYEITSKRVIELLMFEADKRDNKKLI